MATTSTITGTALVEVTDSGTRAAPSASTEGLSAKDLKAVTIIVEADSGQTLSGAGTIDLYVYYPAPGPAAWVEVRQAQLSCNVASVRRLAFNSVEISCPRNGRIVAKPTGVTISSGGVTVYLLGMSSLPGAAYV